MRGSTERLVRLPGLQWLPRQVARTRATIHAKLMAAFLGIVVLFVAVGVIGIEILQGYRDRAGELLTLERRIAAHRQLQHNITEQLYAVTGNLVTLDKQNLDATLRQLDRFAYDFERAQFVAEENEQTLERIKAEYAELIAISRQVIEWVRTGKTYEAQVLHTEQAIPLAGRLERHINSLVNRAEVDMVTQVEANHEAYVTSQYVVIGVALGSVVLALLLGYAISWSLIEPIRQMDARFEKLAKGEFEGRVDVANRDELGDLAEAVNAMSAELDRLYGELESASRHKSEFLANMSHELRTPMNAIIGFNRLVMRRCKDILPQKQYQNLEKIAISADHLLLLINSILDLSKIEAGRMEVHAGEFELAPLLDACVKTVEPIVNGKAVRLSHEMSGEIPVLYSDQDKLRQIVINLLSNAAKFTERGEIRLKAKAENGNVLVSVSDTGSGIPAAQLQSIFESFTQLDSGTTRRQQGTGLGLAISRNLATLIGGELSVESAVGKGSVFKLSFPVRYSIAVPEELADTTVMDAAARSQTT